MDSRVAGLLLVVLTIVFLWLYDTGRWKDIVSTIKGVPATPTTGPVSGGLPGLPGTGVGIGYGGSYDTNSSLGQQICAAWPEACVYTGWIDPAKDFINNTIGGIFGFRL